MPPKTRKTSSVIPNSMAALRQQMVDRYGDRVTRREDVQAYDVISTGSLTLDLATRVGGWVRGRTHEIVGPEGVGKTSLCISSMAQAQQAHPDLAVGYIDMEQTFDWDWASSLGLDTTDERFLHIYPDDSEDVSDQLKMLCRTDLFSMIVVDSIGGMESRQALSKEAEEQTMGRNAQVITRMVKNISVQARQHKVAILFVNQYRANLSNPQGRDISAGPKALRYATTMKVALARTGEPQIKIKDGGDEIPVGTQIRARVERNKVAPAGHVAEFWLMNQATEEYGPVGIEIADEALSIGIRTGVIEQGGGGYYTLPGGERIRGREYVLESMRGDLTLIESIRQKALATYSHEVVPDVVVSFEEMGS